MSQTVLGSISLGYRLLWDRARLPVAVQLFVDSQAAVPVDARHLEAVLTELWPRHAPQLLLSIHSPVLLRDMLAHGSADVAWIEVPEAALLDPPLVQAARQARARGLRLVWQGDAGHRPADELLPLFDKRLVHLSPQEVQAVLRQSSPAQAPGAPELGGHIVEASASHLLSTQCLDQRAAWAVAGWPVQDALRAHQLPLGAAPSVIERLLRAIEADASLEAIEHGLSDDPVLSYRFLLHMNSTPMGRRSEIESLRRGLMMLGYTGLEAWLRTQLAQSRQETDLQPVRTALVTRAHLVERLLDAGDEDELRREVYLCGLLSQIDQWLGEPLAAALERLPLPERIRAALLEHGGPYRPYLDIATALESPRTRATQALCVAQGLNMEEVNRALLRTLSNLRLDASRRWQSA